MRQLRLTLISIICLLPLVALADHEEVLIPVFFQIISIIVFLIVLFAFKLKNKDKIRLAVTYFVSLILIVISTGNTPYDLNRRFIDFSWAAGPAIITLSVFLIMKIKGQLTKGR
jgi:hypothetical protein